MHVEPGLVVALVIGLGVWLYMRWKLPAPEFAPLQTSPGDPLMAEALRKARAGTPTFFALLAQPKDSALVKLRFVSNSDQVENLWAEVLEVLGPQELRVRLVTPPVTHSGHLDRLHRCNAADILDWQVRDREGKIFGGFTQRAMFAIARRDGVKLPRKLLEHEQEYRDT